MTTIARSKLKLKEGCSKCPRCLHVGNTEADFGFRIMNGTKRAQSHCRKCRSGGKKPAPGSRFTEQRPKLVAAHVDVQAPTLSTSTPTVESSACVSVASIVQPATKSDSEPLMGQLLLFGGIKPLRSRRNSGPTQTIAGNATAAAR